MSDIPFTACGMPIQESNALVGFKFAVKYRGKLYVSPAMWSLMQGANQREFLALVHSIKVKDFDPPEHDAEWHLDSMKILVGQLKGLSQASSR